MADDQTSTAKAVVAGPEAAVEERRTVWNRPQSLFLRLRAEANGGIEYIDFEGAVRAGKSLPAATKLGMYGVEYPGIHMAACRWSQDGLNAQVKPLWRSTANRMGIRLKWHPDEEYDELMDFGGSRVYLRALKSSEEELRFGKLAGLTLAVIWIDQAEEVPRDVYEAYVPARLSQVGFPHECWLTPNPPGVTHWIAELFPEHKAISSQHHYIRTSLYDNRNNVGEAYIQDMELAHPAGTVLRRRFIDGHRGLTSTGVPVYQGYFQRRLHEVEPLAMNREVELLEAWDFGHHHPCVVWGQFLPWGALHVLGGIMGESMFLEDFVPIVLAYRAQWFKQALAVRSTGDPAGTARSSQGTNRSAADVLHAANIRLEIIPAANHPDKRNTAIQAVAGYMRRLANGGPAFQISPRFVIVGRDHAQKSYHRTVPVLVDALEAGYVWDERAVVGSRSPNTRRPKKDGYYDHCSNGLEYLVLAFGPILEEPKPQSPAAPDLSQPAAVTFNYNEWGLGWMG